jgi:DNA ligase-4
VFKPVPGRFEVATQGFGESVKDVENALERIVEERCDSFAFFVFQAGLSRSRGEGLVLKAPDSPYILAGREAFWVKVCI